MTGERRVVSPVLSPYTVFALWDEETDEPLLVIEDEEEDGHDN